MNCPTSDKLEKWFDGIVEETEYESIQLHIETCNHCKQLIKMYSNEHHFLKETLSTPTLPDDFAANVLDQLRRRKHGNVFWFRLQLLFWQRD
ncbi:hypothetical protein J7E71_16970 [Mesobacillus foraminis]|uniref:anti-sigma factor family protein n=1 Tax=Mesobacillus foraminis TaxID=279826 RepID=UPI001BEB7180|nr:hypothetical protein [Mesobacillus foraminis]MBT2757585.1 hypothetical protein [Mesobacillus foraminis]